MSVSADVIELAGPVVFFTGAGVSVGAGLPTYRGTGGIYSSSTDEPPNASDLTPQRLPGLWQKFGPRLTMASEVRPALAHAAIAAFEQASSSPVTVVTQNVDGLHQAAGSSMVLELHGTLRWVRCVDAGHRHPLQSLAWDGSGVPECPSCGAACRPDVVLFGEGLDGAIWDAAEQAVRSAAAIVAVGTSAEVYPAVFLIDPELSPDAMRVWVNPETAPPAGDWLWLQGSADEQVPRLRARGA